MRLLITTILLLIGLIGLVQAVNRTVIRSYYAYRNRALIDVVVILLYIMVCTFSGLMYCYSGFDLTVIFIVLSIVVMILIVGTVGVLIFDRRHVKKPALIWFSLYMLVLLYLTLFMRIGNAETTVVTVPFDDLREAFVNRDPAMAKHMADNVLLFLPFGYLIPAINPRRFRS